MQNFILSCESTVDIPFDVIDAKNIPVIFYTYTVDDKIYEDNMSRSAEAEKEFYDILRSGKLPHTSQINVGQYEDFFKTQLQKGDLLHVTFGTGMTGSYNNAVIAAENLREKFPNRKIVVVNSLCSSIGYGMLVEALADLRDNGISIEDAEKFAIENRNKIHHQFFSSNMSFFRRSGRVHGPLAMIATVLNICPIMRLNAKGEIIAYGKVRGKNNAVEKTVSEMLDNISEGEKYSGVCYIGHSDCFDDAILLKEKIESKFPYLKNKIKIYDIGTIIASHSGDGTVAVFFFGKERKN